MFVVQLCVFKDARECCATWLEVDCFAMWLRIECNCLRMTDGESKSVMLMSLVEDSRCMMVWKRVDFFGH